MLLFLFQQVVNPVSFRPLVLTCFQWAVVSMPFQLSNPLPCSWDLSHVYATQWPVCDLSSLSLVQFPKGLVCWLGSEPQVCSLKVSPGVQTRLYAVVSLRSPLPLHDLHGIFCFYATSVSSLKAESWRFNCPIPPGASPSAPVWSQEMGEQREEKQQDLVPISWYHRVIDWTGRVCFFRVWAVATLLLPLQDCLQARMSEKKEKKKWEVLQFPWTLTIPNPSRQARTRGLLLETFPSWTHTSERLAVLRSGWEILEGEKNKTLSGWCYFEFWSSPFHRLLLTF